MLQQSTIAFHLRDTRERKGTRVGATQIEEISRLGALIIPIFLLFIIGLALRFDPNRRVARPSAAHKVFAKWEEPWGALIVLVRIVLIVFLIDATTTLLFGTTFPYIGKLPDWATFRSPLQAILYTLLSLFAIWIVRRLKRSTMSVWDYAIENDMRFEDWRYADPTLEFRPALLINNYRFRMKWWFKTNIEPITTLQTRMILDCPTFEVFTKRIETGDYPKSYQLKQNGKSLLDTRPWGIWLGPIRRLMKKAVLDEVLHGELLWRIWKDQVDQRTGRMITTRDEMARMLFDELRSLIVCRACSGDLTARQTCAACGGSGATMKNCDQCGGSGIVGSKRCPLCDGFGLHHTPIPIIFLERVQYVWAGRNIHYVENTFPLWLSNLGHLIVYTFFTGIFLLISWFSGAGVTLDTIVQSLLFGGAALVGSLGVAIILIFGTAFNSSGTFFTSYPLRVPKFGDTLWIKLMQLIALLSFGTLLIDTTFVMGQFLIARQSNPVLIIAASSTLTVFAVLFSVGGIYRIHIAMRDAKRSRLDELEHWFQSQADRRDDLDIAKEEELFKDVRELQEWPLDGTVVFGIVSGVVLPVVLSLISFFASSSLFH